MKNGCNRFKLFQKLKQTIQLKSDILKTYKTKGSKIVNA